MASQEPKREDEPVVVEPARRRLHLREVRSDTKDYDGIGSELRAARVRTGVELADVAQKLRISGAYLDALEAGRFADLPGDVYVFGFLRSYARFLNLDEQIVIERYRSEAAGPRRETRLEFPSAMDRGRMPTGRLLLGGLVIAIVAYAAWFVLTSEERSTAERVAPIPDRLAAAESERTPAAAARTIDTVVSSSAAGAGPEEQTEISAPSSEVAGGEAAVGRVASDTEGAVSSDVEPNGEADVAAPSVATEGSVAQSGAVEAEVAAAPAAPTPERREGEGQAVAEVGSTDAEAETEAQDGGARARVAAVASDSVEPTQTATVSTKPPQVPPLQASQRRSEGDENALRVMQLAEASSAPIAATGGNSGEEAPGPRSPSTARPETGEVVVAATQPAAPPPLAPSADEDSEATSEGYVPRTFGAGNEGARIVLVAESDSWVQVRATTGELLLTRVLRPGDRYLVPDRPDLLMMTGNIGALRLVVDGETLPPLGPMGVIGRNIPLDAERLRTGQVSVRDDISP